LLSTLGGQVAQGIAVYNVLRALPISVTTYNVGSVNSIGNVIAAGNRAKLSQGGIGTEGQTMVAISASGSAQEQKYKPLVVRAPDGVTIAAQEWGNPAGPEILFIHGFSQASLSWKRQVESDLAKEFRMVTYDLRGHGNSDKPFEPEKYKESKAWADEVQAIIDAANFKHPVLVGWSYGVHVIAAISGFTVSLASRVSIMSTE
jgi:alpha/beta hydrolase fold/Clp protease